MVWKNEPEPLIFLCESIAQEESQHTLLPTCSTGAVPERPEQPLKRNSVRIPSILITVVSDAKKGLWERNDLISKSGFVCAEAAEFGIPDL